jgi:hypothetical protein
MTMPRLSPAELEAEADALITGEPQAPENQDTPPATDPPPAPAGDPSPQDPDDGEPEDEPEPQPEPEPAPEPEPEDDLKGLTLKNAGECIKNAQTRMHAATAEAAQLRKEKDAIARELEDARADLRRLEREVETLKARPAPAAPSAPAPAPVADGKLKALVDEYPEMAAVVDEMLGLRQKNEQLSGQVTQMQTQIAETGRKVDTRSDKERIDEHLSTIRKKHSDFDKIKASDDFKGWRARQAPVVQEALNKGTAADVIWALDLYKADVGIGKRKGKLGAAVTAAEPDMTTNREPPTGQKRIFTNAEIAAMSDEEFAANEAEIDKAMAEGRVRK